MNQLQMNTDILNNNRNLNTNVNIQNSKTNLTSVNNSERTSKPQIENTKNMVNINMKIDKENLYTDPKLLEMIRKDLQDLN